MARRRALSQKEAVGLRETGMHWVADNLYLQIREQGTRSGLYRYRGNGKPKVVCLHNPPETSASPKRRTRPTRLKHGVEKFGRLIDQEPLGRRNRLTVRLCCQHCFGW